MTPPNRERGRPLPHRLLDHVFRPVDAASMAVVRIGFGLLAAALMFRLFTTGPLERLYLAQTLHFKYPFFGWIPDPAPSVLYLVVATAGLAALLMALGLLYRAVSIVFFLTWSYVFLFDQTAYQNHDYLLCLLGFLFALMPLNRYWALDARIWPALKSDTLPAWCLHIFRFQIAIVYVFGAVRKLNPDWLHGEPIRSMLHGEAFEHPLVGAWFFSEPLVWVFVWGGLLFDLFIVPALLWRVTRLPALAVSVAFHLTNAWLWDIDIFPWFMIVATLTFFPPESPRRLAAWFRFSPQAPDLSWTPPRSYTNRQRGLAAVLAVYALIQILLPCRPFLHPGHPLEQQDLLVFSWNMMLRLKDTRLRFIVADKATGERWEVPPEAFLSRFQLGRLGSPDMMHQAALYLAERSRLEGHPNVAVYLDGQHRLNVRRWQVAYDPKTDLAATPRTLGAKPWVMPLVEWLPPDPGPRTDYYREKWAFCKGQGLLPLGRHAGDPEVLERLRTWAVQYRAKRGGVTDLAE